MSEIKFTLKSYDPVEIEISASAVTDELVDEEIGRYLKAHSKTVPVDGRSVRLGDIAKIQVHVERDGEPVPAFESSDRLYEVGAGYMPEEFDRGLIGMDVGEERDFCFSVIDATGDEHTVLDAHVKLLELREERIPDLTDAWVSENILGCTCIREFRQLFHDQLNEQIEPMRQSEIENAVARALASRLVEEIPQKMIDEGVKESIQGFKQMLSSNDMSVDDFMKQEAVSRDQLEVELYVQARQLLEQNAALEALADYLELSVSEQDIMDSIPMGSPDDKRNLIAKYEADGLADAVRRIALRSKALRQAVDSAIVIERR